MPRSARFRDMQAALTELKKQFLPAKFDPTGTYRDLVLARARAFRVLSHAEVEHFLEDRAKEVATDALTKWKNAKTVNKPLMSLIAFSGREMQIPPETLAPSQTSASTKHQEQLDLAKRVDMASRMFFQMIKDNHGLKERNILRLLIPIGFDHHDLDPIWLVTMNSFGEARGEAAHLSARLGTVSHPPDPKTEFDLLNDVVTGLKDVDEKLTALKA